jgi:hypothetical protein
VTKSFENVSPTLARISGILPIVGGGSLVLREVWWSLEFGFYFSFSTLLVLVLAGLAIAGGGMALAGKFMIAPWLLLASALLSFPVGLVAYRIFYWPWETFAWVPYAFSEYNVISAVILLVAAYAWWLIAIGAVLAIIVFARAPHGPEAPAPVTAHMRLAVVSEDGSIAEGWYADPNGLPSERFWDGSQWTDQTRPLTTTTAGVAVAAVRPTMTPTGQPISDKSRAAAAILCWFLGVFGVHRFYVGKVGTGIAMIFTLGGLGIWALIDFIMILVGAFKDISGKVLMNW